MNELSPSQQLDIVLNFLCNEKSAWELIDLSHAIENKISIEQYKFFDPASLYAILQKLCKSEYVFVNLSYHERTKQNEKYYIATFDGKYFISKGGFEAELQSSRIEQNAKEDQHRWQLRMDEQTLKNADKLNNLTAWLVFGSIFLAGIEILKLFLEYWDDYSICWPEFCLFAFGIAIGIVISYLVRKSPRLHKK